MENMETKDLINNEVVEEVTEFVPNENNFWKKAGAVAGIGAAAIGLWEGGKRVYRWTKKKLNERKSKKIDAKKTENVDDAVDMTEEIPPVK